MMNPQSYAVRIEQKLRTEGYAKLGDADSIRADPMTFMNNVLCRYERISKDNEERAANFWDMFEHFCGCRLDEFGEDAAREFTTAIVNLF